LVGLAPSLLTVLAATLPMAALAATLTPGGDLPDLQAVVDAAAPGDVVLVPPGEWKGPLHVDIPLTLRGAGGHLTGDDEGTVLFVEAPHVVIENLHITGSGEDLSADDSCLRVEPAGAGVVVRDNVFTECAFGIWLHEVHEGAVERNHVEGKPLAHPTNRGNGIHLFDSKSLMIRGNYTARARDGIYISATEESLIVDNVAEYQRYGVHYMYSYDNTLRGNISRHNKNGYALMESKRLHVVRNVAEFNEHHGLLFRDAEHCLIEHNRLERNGEGLFFFSSVENIIVDNRVAHNEVGAKIWAGSKRNEISRNNFIGNRKQVMYVSTQDQHWGQGRDGNYWSDYFGWDQDGDGVGDRPYRLDSFTSNLTYRFPAAVLLMRSPSLEMLGHLQRRLPVFRVPTVIDHSPLAAPRSGRAL
jgi:nitrous oxidase accessory protein